MELHEFLILTYCALSAPYLIVKAICHIYKAVEAIFYAQDRMISCNRSVEKLRDEERELSRTLTDVSNKVAANSRGVYDNASAIEDIQDEISRTKLAARVEVLENYTGVFDRND